MKSTAELSEDGKRIVVKFPYHPAWVKRAKSIPGAAFVKPHRGGPGWSYPLSLKMGKILRETFGLGLKFSDELVEWGRERKREEGQLRSLARSTDATLSRLPTILPDLSAFIDGRPYQRADVALMAQQSLINANEMGLGKTTEVIAAVVEADLMLGRHLVVTPVTSIETVWFDEIARWMNPNLILTGEDPASRAAAIEEAHDRAGRGLPFWLIVNPDMIRYTNDEEKGLMPKHPLLFDIYFDTCTIDEFHKMGLSNPKALGSIGAGQLKSHRKWALSGTPIGGKPINLWAVLNWIAPDRFPSQWQWAKEWLVVSKNGFGHKYGDIQPGREDEFYAYHAPFLLRRTKRECLPDLPEKTRVNVWCRMGKQQRRQYEKFALDAEIKIDERRLTGTSILAEYTYLKMFASARCEIRGDKLHPTTDSGKLLSLLDRLERHNVTHPKGESAIVATQSSRMATVVVEFLQKHGIDADLIAGKTKQADRTRLVRSFSKGEPRVLVLVTAAGGVALNLQRADSVHILDETWNPDDQLQVEDRGDRGSRTKGLVVYYYRSRGTIEEDVYQVTSTKRITSKNILDVRRRGWK